MLAGTVVSMVEMKPTLDHCPDRPLLEQRSVAPHFLNGGNTDPCSTEAKGHLRILLSEAASATLTATGESAFLIVGKVSWPDDPSRWVIHLVPVPMATAAAACQVALGERKPGPRVKGPPAPPEAVTALSDGKTGTIQTPVQTPAEMNH